MQSMRQRCSIAGICLCVAGLLLPLSAQASGFDIQQMALNLLEKFRLLWISIGALSIVVAGFGVVLSQEEGQAKKARKTINAVLVGGMIITVIGVLGPINLLNTIYNGTYGTTVSQGGLGTVELESLGVAQWVATLAAMIGLLLIIVAMIEAVASFGADEAAYTKVRTSLIHVTIGVVVIAAAFAIKSAFFTPAYGGVANPNPLIVFITGKILFVFGFLLFVATAILIYAGIRMVASIGREEDFTAAKNLLVRVVVGIVVIAVSYALVRAVAGIFT